MSIRRRPNGRWFSQAITARVVRSRLLSSTCRQRSMRCIPLQETPPLLQVASKSIDTSSCTMSWPSPPQQGPSDLYPSFVAQASQRVLRVSRRPVCHCRNPSSSNSWHLTSADSQEQRSVFQPSSGRGSKAAGHWMNGSPLPGGPGSGAWASMRRCCTGSCRPKGTRACTGPRRREGYQRPPSAPLPSGGPGLLHRSRSSGRLSLRAASRRCRRKPSISASVAGEYARASTTFRKAAREERFLAGLVVGENAHRDSSVRGDPPEALAANEPHDPRARPRSLLLVQGASDGSQGSRVAPEGLAVLRDRPEWVGRQGG